MKYQLTITFEDGVEIIATYPNFLDAYLTAAKDHSTRHGETTKIIPIPRQRSDENKND